MDLTQLNFTNDDMVFMFLFFRRIVFLDTYNLKDLKCARNKFHQPHPSPHLYPIIINKSPRAFFFLSLHNNILLICFPLGNISYNNNHLLETFITHCFINIYAVSIQHQCQDDVGKNVVKNVTPGSCCTKVFQRMMS